MYLKFYLQYIILATYKTPFITSKHRGRDQTWFLVRDESTVSRTVQLFHRTGRVAARHHPCDTNRMLTAPAQLFVLNLVLQKPGMYLHETQAELQDFLMLNVSIPTICKFLHKEWILSSVTTHCSITTRFFLEGTVNRKMVVAHCI